MIAGSDTLEFAAGANVGEFASKAETMIKNFLGSLYNFSCLCSIKNWKNNKLEYMKEILPGYPS